MKRTVKDKAGRKVSGVGTGAEGRGDLEQGTGQEVFYCRLEF
jgi:hypothetical protein